MKKIPDITEQALKKALGELERSIRDTKRESRATDERVAAMDSQRAQLADEVASAHDRCDGKGRTICRILKYCLWKCFVLHWQPWCKHSDGASTDVMRET